MTRALVIDSADAPADVSSGGPGDLGKVRYIGSKARVVDEIMAIVGSHGPSDGCFVDAFCGTGAVASAAADRGWPVRINDNLESAVIVASARLVSGVEVPFERLDNYRTAIDRLNSSTPVAGFFWREYSVGGPSGRMYFTEDNAHRIDGVRERLATWSAEGLISPSERSLLVADLISAVGRVANIAGTYGCYLSKWTPAALGRLELRARTLRSRPVTHEAFCGDVSATPMEPGDTVYLDPPYTKRQYAAYYHVNETLAAGDEPTVGGKTGLRPWQSKASDYCYKTRALGALNDLIDRCAASRVLLSYSSEGHVDLGDLHRSLADRGQVEIHALGAIGRYRPNGAASSKASEVSEYLIEVLKSPTGLRDLEPVALA